VTRGPEADDRELVARFLRARDESSFRSIYRRHTPALYGLALRLLGHRAADAEDAVQEAWIRGVERLDRFRWESTLRTWLGSIVVNCCRERRRDAWRWHQPSPDAAESANEDASPLELTIAVDRALAALPAGCRSVFVLHDVEGRTHEEIGALLGISSGTSKSQLFHARRRLRALLQEGR
jgi:RNA polymerase sigma-70 factor, ECF subfamily